MPSRPKPGRRGGVEADAVVDDLDHRVGVGGQPQHDPAGAGVPPHVRQRLLDRPHQHHRPVGADLGVAGPGALDDDLDPGLGAEPRGDPGERGVDVGALQVDRCERRHQRAGLAQVLAGGLLDQVEPGGVVARGRQPGRLGLRQRHDAGEPLREGVVDLAGHPLALGHHAGGVLRDAQLGPGALELGDQVRALLALLDDPADPQPEHQRDRQAAAHRHHDVADRVGVGALAHEQARAGHDAQHDRPDHAGAVRRGVEPDLGVGGEQHERGAAALEAEQHPDRHHEDDQVRRAPPVVVRGWPPGSPSSRYARARTPTAASDCGAVSPGSSPTTITAPSTTSRAAKVRCQPSTVRLTTDGWSREPDPGARCRRPRPLIVPQPASRRVQRNVRRHSAVPTTSQTRSTSAVSPCSQLPPGSATT